ncbi:MAG TPA: hypothetical protein VGP68_24265, partial [Gemmataceae bacterium]|nr:hypothetical protein [Gemmataceae bacterium]
TNPIAFCLLAGLFQDDSLLYKSLPNTLTGEQIARYRAIDQERQQYRHLANIKLVVTYLETGMPLLDAQRQKLIALLKRESKPVRKPGPYDSYFYIWQLGHLPEEKIKPLFDDAQWRALNQILVQYQAMEPMLKQAGYFQAGDENEVNADVPAAARKK